MYVYTYVFMYEVNGRESQYLPVHMVIFLMYDKGFYGD
jgi:hypothetical protein